MPSTASGPRSRARASGRIFRVPRARASRRGLRVPWLTRSALGTRRFRSTRFVALPRVRRRLLRPRRFLRGRGRASVGEARWRSRVALGRVFCSRSFRQGRPVLRFAESAPRTRRSVNRGARSRRARGVRREHCDHRSRNHVALVTLRRALRRGARDHVAQSLSASRTQ